MPLRLWPILLDFGCFLLKVSFKSQVNFLRSFFVFLLYLLPTSINNLEFSRFLELLNQSRCCMKSFVQYFFYY